MEQELLGVNKKKLSSPRKKKIDEDFLNTSIKMVKSIDKSLMILDNIEPSVGEEIIEVPGAKLNKLWQRLTGSDEVKYEDLDKSNSSFGVSEMDIVQDSLIQTEPLISIDNSSVDADGSIIPEIKEIQITDMDDDGQDQLIEDTSFPNFDISINEVTPNKGRNDLPTITECTEYEQSQGSSNDEISSDVGSTAATSERTNSEIEKRLISINDSLEEVNEAFKKIAIINRSPSTVTYSTDKDFVDSPKASTPESNERPEANVVSTIHNISSSIIKSQTIEMIDGILVIAEDRQINFPCLKILRFLIDNGKIRLIV